VEPQAIHALYRYNVISIVAVIVDINKMFPGANHLNNFEDWFMRGVFKKETELFK
jgi:hypothetical protein